MAKTQRAGLHTCSAAQCAAQCTVTDTLSLYWNSAVHALALSAQQGQGLLQLCVELVITIHPHMIHMKRLQTDDSGRERLTRQRHCQSSYLPRKQKVELIRWASGSFRARLKGPTSVDCLPALDPVSFLLFSASKQVEGCWAKHKGAFGNLVTSG